MATSFRHFVAVRDRPVVAVAKAKQLKEASFE